MSTLEPIDIEPTQWVDPEDFFAEPTEEEIALGNQLGQSIDPDDDHDNGIDP